MLCLIKQNLCKANVAPLFIQANMLLSLVTRQCMRRYVSLGEPVWCVELNGQSSFSIKANGVIDISGWQELYVSLSNGLDMHIQTDAHS